MFGIMNSVIRVATLSAPKTNPTLPELPMPRWSHREAIERTQALRGERDPWAALAFLEP